MPANFGPHTTLGTSDSMESTEPPYPTIEIVQPSPPVSREAPDHHQILQEMTFHSIHSRLLEIDCKMSRLESKFYEDFARLESSVAKCQRTIELVNESLGIMNKSSASESSPRDMMVNLRFGHREQSQLFHTIRHATNQAESTSVSEQVMNNPCTSFHNRVIERKRSGLLKRIKDQVRSGEFSKTKI